LTKRGAHLRSITKIAIIAALTCLTLLCSVQVWNYLRYGSYRGHKQFISLTDDYEEGGVFTPIEDAGDVGLKGMVLAEETSVLKLYVNAATGETAILDRRTGVVTRSNPVDADEDMLANSVNKSALKSQLIIEHYTRDSLAGSYNSFEHSTSNGDIAIERISKGIRLIYTFGRSQSNTGIAPLIISQERFGHYVDELLSMGEEKAAKNLTSRYRPSQTIDGFMELPESFRTGAGTLRTLNEALALSGYTEEDYAIDMASAEMGTAGSKEIEVPLEYRLDDDSLIVSIPISHIRESADARVVSVGLLPTFAAAGANDSGYFLLPNGSGSLMRFNNGKTSANAYHQDIYGTDALSSSDYLSLEKMSPARFPILGIENRATILASIEEGAALASVAASVAGKVNSYNTAHFSFTARGAGSLAMFGIAGESSELPVLEDELYNINLSVRYSFLPPEQNGFSGMANYLRERLISDWSIKISQKHDDVPFYMDVVGGAIGEKLFLGTHYEGTITMSTFAQASEMSELLSTLGVKRQYAIYSGWFNRGYYHDAPDRINLLRSLGTKDELERFSETLAQSGGKLYVDAAFQLVSFASKRFNPDWEASQYYSGVLAATGGVDPVTFVNYASFGHYETVSSLLSPKFLPRYVSSFVSEIKDYKVDGVALRDLGSVLHSDSRRKEIINRHEAEGIVCAKLDEFANSGKQLLISGGNYYSLPYADDLAGVPLIANSQDIVDESVPFYEMVLHGCIDYSGESINLTDSYSREEVLLDLLECAASPRFTFTWNPAGDLINTGLNRFYGATFANWMEESALLYNELNAVLSRVSGEFIIDFEIFGKLRVASYGNGIKIAVNRGNEAAVYSGVSISAGSYAVLEAVR
jgi:hypothetical protein